MSAIAYQDIESLLKDSVEAQLKNSPDAPPKPPCAVVIRFRDPSRMDAFVKLVEPIVSDFYRHENLLLKLCENQAAAQTLNNTLNRVLTRFDDAVIAQPFEPDWLEHFFKVANFGVDVIITDHHVTSVEKITPSLSKRVKDYSDALYENKVKEAKIASLDYTDEQFVEDFTDFLASNWEGYSSQDGLKAMFRKVAAIFREETQGDDFLSSHPAQNTLFAMFDKDEVLHSQDGIPEQMEYLEAVSKVRSKFRARIGATMSNDRWTQCKMLACGIMSDMEPSLRPKGLDLLLDNKDAKSAPLTPFKGIVLEDDYESNMEMRLSPHTLSYRITEQGDKLFSLLAGAVAAYWLQVMQWKHDEAFKRSLWAFSKEMDKRSLKDNLLELATLSQPNPKE